MSEYEEQMNAWLKQIEDSVDLTVEEKEEINGNGAKVLKEEIAKETRSKHHNGYRKIGNMPHLSDSVVSGQIDGEPEDGHVGVGFSKKDYNHARIARFLNDGTVKMRGDSFYDKAYISAQHRTQKAINDKLEEVQKRKYSK